MRKALILSQKEVGSTPRILREVDVLSEMGFEITTVGWGRGLPGGNCKHIELSRPQWMKRYLAYLCPLKRVRAKLLTGPRPTQWPALAGENFSVVIVHDPSILTAEWAVDLCTNIEEQKLHVDLHEDFTSSISRNWIEKKFFYHYRTWEMKRLVAIIENRPQVSVSAVSGSIAQNYKSLLKRDVSVVANTPDGILESPSHVSETRVDLVHHGVGTFGRGIESSVRAMKLMPDYFHLNLMLVATPLYRSKIQILARYIGVNDRLHWVNPVATEKIAEEVNKFDIALVFIEPLDQSELWAMPNKLFESASARLAIACGPNPDISDFVRRHELGIAGQGWSPRDIAETAIQIVESGIMKYKEASSSEEVQNYLRSSRQELREIFSKKIYSK